MEDKNRFVEKIKAQLTEWDAQLDEMKAAAVESSAQLAASYRSRIQSLKTKRDALAHKLALLADAADDAWEDFRQGVENAWDELKHAFDEDEKRDRKRRG